MALLGARDGERGGREEGRDEERRDEHLVQRVSRREAGGGLSSSREVKDLRDVALPRAHPLYARAPQASPAQAIVDERWHHGAARFASSQTHGARGGARWRLAMVTARRRPCSRHSRQLRALRVMGGSDVAPHDQPGEMPLQKQRCACSFRRPRPRRTHSLEVGTAQRTARGAIALVSLRPLVFVLLSLGAARFRQRCTRRVRIARHDAYHRRARRPVAPSGSASAFFHRTASTGGCSP